MTCGFFCDTGVIHGACRINDHHEKSCKFFLSKYPMKDYDYFVPKVVVNEITHQKYTLNRNANKLSPEEMSIARTFQRCVDAFLRNVTLFDAQEHGKPYMNNFNNLIIELQKVIHITGKNQINDIELIAQAIVWSTLNWYENHNLITVDKKDIASYSKKKKIIHMASKCIKSQVKLEIVYLPNLTA
jgi:hypothetical protein